MEYNASAVNAEEGPPLKLLNDSLLCINLLRVPTRTLHQLREGTNIERNQLGKQLVTRVEHLVQHPPQQHTATGRPSNHLFKVLNTIGSQSRSTVVAVRHMTYRDNTDNMYEPEHSIRRHVLKVFPFNSPEDVQYDAQQVAVSKMGISDGVLQASDIGIAWLKYDQQAQAQPALVMLMSTVEESTLDDVLTRWQVPSALKPSASMILRKTFDLLLGLSTMHELGVVHRDMKPSNIGIVQGRLVGLDPGFASDDDELVEHPAVTGTYMYMAPELDLASVQAALLQPLLLMSAEMRDVSSEGGVGAGHCWQQVQELRVATELQISRPDYAYKANIFSVGMLLLQMVTYGKPPFWMLHVINPKSPQELQEEVIELWIKLGPRKLLEATYWHPLHKPDYPIIMELDSLLLDFLSEALAPPWRRQDAQQLAGHPLFESLGASLVIELERDLESDAEDRLEHLLCCWSLYHHEAAKRLCSNEVAADVLCSSADPEVKATAEEASETSESLILGCSLHCHEVAGDSVLFESIALGGNADTAHIEQLCTVVRNKVSQKVASLNLVSNAATAAAAAACNVDACSASGLSEPSGAGPSGASTQASGEGLLRSSSIDDSSSTAQVMSEPVEQSTEAVTAA